MSSDVNKSEETVLKTEIFDLLEHKDAYTLEIDKINKIIAEKYGRLNEARNATKKVSDGD